MPSSVVQSPSSTTFQPSQCTVLVLDLAFHFNMYLNDPYSCFFSGKDPAQVAIPRVVVWLGCPADLKSGDPEFKSCPNSLCLKIVNWSASCQMTFFIFSVYSSSQKPITITPDSRYLSFRPLLCSIIYF